jgi:cellulose synthase/poly-beta-1,6-N-acetylglucosamine synthase-like glycosyltransferase
VSALGVVISCYRQERYLERTVRALERALEGRDWHGVLEIAAPSDAPLPALSERWTVITSTDPVTGALRRALTPGAGRMTGFRACGGEWVLFLDSDMELDRAWVDAALALAAREPQLAGIGGRIEEWFTDGATARPGKHDMYGSGEREHAVPYLANVALYRRAALDAVGGYDEWLHSDEDFELGMKLGFLGLEMRVLGMRAGRHWSAPRPSFPELTRRWRTGLCFGQGEVLRLYFGRRGMGTLLRRQWLYIATMSLWLLGLVALIVALFRSRPGPLLAWAALPLALLAFMSLRKRSVRLAVHSILTWTLNGLGMVTGFFHAPPRGARVAIGAARRQAGGA